MYCKYYIVLELYKINKGYYKKNYITSKIKKTSIKFKILKNYSGDC